MLNTGYILFITEEGADFDADGNPEASTKEVWDPIPCNITTITKEYNVLADGDFVQAKFSVILEDSSIPAELDIDTVKQVTLQDSLGNDLGTYRVNNMEHLLLTQRIKIVL